MAESSVQSAVQWLGTLLEQEAENLQGIHQKVEQLRDELDWMQCFLREADAARHTDPRIRRWVSQAQEIACEAEDIVETFLYKLISHQDNPHRTGSRAASIKNRLDRYLWVLREAKAVHDATKNIETLRGKIATLTSRLQAYGIKITRSDHPGAFCSTLQGLNVVKEERTFELDDQVKQLVTKLVGVDAGENRVFGIWGKDGVGKSTLARKVYQNQTIRKQFKKFAWVYVPKNYKTAAGLLRRLLRSLSGRSSDEVDRMRDQELVKEVYEVQHENKCLVIIEDIWSTEIWDSLKEAFPGDDERDSGSKVLFTTHSRQVAEHVNDRRPNNIHEMKCLSYDASWELLQTKLGGIPLHIFGNDGVNEMMNMAKKMLKPCQGIPLAIIALGGLLAARKTSEEWQTLLDHMNSPHKAKLHQPYEKVLELCYYGLPYYLKNCFLHLGSFPEDFAIPVNRLCHLWAAEGIITLPNGENSLEEFSEHCLRELLQRGMVQVAKRGHQGNIKSCCVHDIMRDLCLKVSREENLLSIVGSDSNFVNGKARRLALHLGDEEEDDDETSLSHRNQLLRSLLLFSSRKDAPQVSYGSVKALCKDSQLLRVLDLEGIVISSNTLPREIGDLMYLRYLSLKDMLLTRLPPSIGYLVWLETLDLRVKLRMEIPNVLSRLERLRNLYLPRNFTVKDSKKLRLDNLNNLLILKNVNHFEVEDVLGMKNLKKASIKCMPENEHLEFIKRSPKVVFGLTIFRALIGEDQVNVLQGFNNLTKLELKGGVSAPITSLTFPSTVKKLVLDFCGIQQDPMPVLEKLPGLVCLCLDHQAYMGKMMVCSASGFPKLAYLRLNGLKNLEEWNVEQGSMPKLLHLEAKGCEKLAKIPEELPQQVQIAHV